MTMQELKVLNAQTFVRTLIMKCIHLYLQKVLNKPLEYEEFMKNSVFFYRQKTDAKIGYEIEGELANIWAFFDFFLEKKFGSTNRKDLFLSSFSKSVCDKRKNSQIPNNVCPNYFSTKEKDIIEEEQKKQQDLHSTKNSSNQIFNFNPQNGLQNFHPYYKPINNLNFNAYPQHNSQNTQNSPTQSNNFGNINSYCSPQFNYQPSTVPQNQDNTVPSSTSPNISEDILSKIFQTLEKINQNLNENSKQISSLSERMNELEDNK